MADKNLNNAYNIIDVDTNHHYLKHAIVTDKKTIIPFGLLPGLNANIDTQQNEFEQDLLHNFTFTDLSPVTYDLKIIKQLEKIFGNIPNYTIAKINEAENGLAGATNAVINYFGGKGDFKTDRNTDTKWKPSNFDIMHNNLYSYNEKNTNNVNRAMHEAFKKYFGNILSEDSIPVFRLIGSQDSVYTETLQNKFGANSLVDDITSVVKGGLHSISESLRNRSNDTDASRSSRTRAGAGAGFIDKATGAFSAASSFLNKLPKYSYDDGIALMRGINNMADNNIAGLITKELLGLQIGLPRVYEGSDYSESLNLFLRLTSPTGHDDDIKHYIISPLLMLLMAAAPISFDGMDYGFPPVFRIQSYGNANNAIGVIDVVTITRGSMETSYSDKLQPLSVDIRITISSLSHNYSTVLNDSVTKDALTKQISVGLNNPANTYQAFDQENSDKIKPTIINLGI